MRVGDHRHAHNRFRSRQIFQNLDGTNGARQKIASGLRIHEIATLFIAIKAYFTGATCEFCPLPINAPNAPA